MASPYRIEAYAIVSADGMIADSSGVMPDSLKNEADHQFLGRRLDLAAAVVHGRNSHENQANSPLRPRLIVTRKIPAIAADLREARTVLWNPAGAPFNEACGALGVDGGTIAILGGTAVYDLFLGIGYDAFHLSRAGKARVPGGTPVLSRVCAGCSPEDVLTQFGFTPGPTVVLDERDAVTVVSWTRGTPA